MIFFKNILSAKARIITYLSILSLILVLGLQVYVVYDYFRLTRYALSKEINRAFDEACEKEVSLRFKSLFSFKGSSPKMKVSTSSKDKDVVVYDFDKMNVDKKNVMGLFNSMVSDFTNKRIPLNLQLLDSITRITLEKHNINPEFSICLDNKQSGKRIFSTKTFNADINSRFVITSKLHPLAYDQQQSLQLILLNPLSNIIKRMGLLLAGSILLALLCLYGIWFLFRTLAYQKQLNAMKNDFFGHTAHELKRPVAHLMMALEALSRPSIDENKLKKERYLAISKEATRDMSEKIAMIMTLSMAEEGMFRLNYSEFDLNEVIEVLKEKFTAVAEKCVSIYVQNIEEKTMISADKEHLTQSIANLIDNAIKYSNDSVHITISVQSKGKDLILCVKDNGIGIAQDKISSVFQKYTRLNTVEGSPAGFGIGLSYVKTVIEKHAGRIEVISELAKGSEFKIQMPVLS
ncbi:sensor histidine kinase [Parabacteroides sp. FAFU027]|uniref:sensor histidine kinase n=1 Tax=Parabacteroides sp. FAFU027 TaxID=2922715 RepID=UPI001FAF1423|nr:HAMP domain-containing sensor histidine kinase [Parabacteroides sp. FAFU027]